MSEGLSCRCPRSLQRQREGLEEKYIMIRGVHNPEARTASSSSIVQPKCWAGLGLDRRGSLVLGRIGSTQASTWELGRGKSDPELRERERERKPLSFLPFTLHLFSGTDQSSDSDGTVVADPRASTVVC